ncbi:hypothetical protein P7K49_020241, partial [Saguinus oedipus]
QALWGQCAAALCANCWKVAMTSLHGDSVAQASNRECGVTPTCSVNASRSEDPGTRRSCTNLLSWYKVTEISLPVSLGLNWMLKWKYNFKGHLGSVYYMPGPGRQLGEEKTQTCAWLPKASSAKQMSMYSLYQVMCQ